MSRRRPAHRACRPSARSRARGFLLLPFALALAVIAALALLLVKDAALIAQRSGSRLEAAEATYVAEAGLEHARWNADSAMCTGYQLPSTAFDGGSYSATFTPTSGSPVTIEATGTLSSGVARTITRTAVAVYGLQTSSTLQPDSAGDDAYIADGAQADSNFGGDVAIPLSNAMTHVRGLLRFDLSTIPSTARIESASLELNLEGIASANTGTVAVHRVTADWDEAGVTWNDALTATPWTAAGGDYDATPVATAAVDSAAPGTVSWDVGDLVAEWMAGTYANHGILLEASSGIDGATFTSSDATNAALRPKLVVTYRCECGGSVSTLVAQPDPTTGTDTYLDQSVPTQNFGADIHLHVEGSAGTPYHSLLKFDLSAIPTNAVVTEAYLDLYQSAAADAGGPIEVHALTRTWSEGGGSGAANWNEAEAGVSWTTAGGDYDSTVAATFTLPASTKGTFEWDVTALTGEWVSGTRTNYGVALIPGGSSAAAQFSSSDSSPATTRPRLTVNYTCPCGTVCTAPVANSNVTLPAVGDDTLYADAAAVNHGTDLSLPVGTADASGGGASRRAILTFDLSSIPAGSTITSALLRLNAATRTGSAGFDLEVHRLTQAWVEAESTWNDAQAATPWSSGGGGTYSATVVATQAAATAGWYEWEIGPLVQEWLDSVSPNYGLELVHSSVAQGNRLGFDSREGTNPPELVVDYTAP